MRGLVVGGAVKNRLTGIAIAATLLGTPAFAADMAVKAPPPPPPPAVTTWTGFYLGVNGGWSGGTSQDSWAFLGVNPGPKFNQNGGLAGVTYGHNWQFGRGVLGFEGDFDLADINGSYTNPMFCGTASCFTRLKNFSTDRVRVGVDLNGWLPYVTGGLGFGQVNAGQSPCAVVAGGGLVAPQSSCNETWRAGWVAGAGVEKMIAPHWSAKIEYLHYDFGSNGFADHGWQYFGTLGVFGASPFFTLERGDMVRAGINYHFADTANAADMPVKAAVYKAPAPVTVPSNWTSVYLGINGGYSGGTSVQTDWFGVTTGHYSENGGLAGVTYGANWQFGRSGVLGFEGDFDYARINGTINNAAICSITGGSACFTDLKNFSTDRVRVGVDLDGWLPYVTGGVGFGQVNAGQTPCGPTIFGLASPTSSCAERWRAGWVAGAGVEKMIAPHWSAKIEYLHYDFGDTTSSAHAAQYFTASIGGGNWVDVLERGDIVRAGINYHFDVLSRN
jgi:outer membrane immunogenic protein